MKKGFFDPLFKDKENKEKTIAQNGKKEFSDWEEEDDEEADNEPFNFFAFLKDTIFLLLVAAAIAVPIKHYLVHPFLVKGSSMEPNFKDREYLVINEMSYRLGDPKRGDVIVFKYPKDPKEYYIKRIIALPGERLELSEGRITIFNSENTSGLELKEDYILEGQFTKGDISAELGADEYFVMGDNRLGSSDSRSWGKLPRSLIVGKTWIRLLPLNRLTIFSLIKPFFNLDLNLILWTNR
jgi:signal peptidase I